MHDAQKRNIKNTKYMQDALSSHFVWQYLLDKPKGVRGRSSDNTMVKDKLGWEPKFTLSQGLEQTYFWIKNEITKNTD